MDGPWWYLNLVAHRGRSISRPIPVSYFIIVWEVSDAFILIVDNGNELHYCSQTQKYCMTNIFMQYCHTSVLNNCDCTLCESVSQKMSLFCLAITLT